jgi:hypothetical protein
MREGSKEIETYVFEDRPITCNPASVPQLTFSDIC